MLLGRGLSLTREAVTKVSRPVLVRFCSETKVIRVSSNLELRTRQNATQNEDTSTKPLVLVYGWMLPQRRHLEKFENIYLARGSDVMTINIQPQQLLWPKTGAQVIAKKVVDFVQQPQNASRPLMVHAFSVGGYLYGETLLKSFETPQDERSMKDRIVGQIFDSPVDFIGIPDGLPSAMTRNVAARFLGKMMIKAYMSALFRQVTIHYIRSSQIFHENPVRGPSLFLYSKIDPVGTVESIERVASMYVKNLQNQVYYKCWDDSPHVQHMYKHPIEYVELMDNFLSNLPPFAGRDATMRDNGNLQVFSLRQ